MNRSGTPRRAALAVLLTVAAVLSAGSEFNGCGGGDRPPTGGALPTSTTGDGCLVDADCVSEDMCVALACVMRECVPAGLGTDDDGDGYAPPPCGEDCNDNDSRTFPGATELCDGLDQDCDGETDEDAVGVTPYVLEREIRFAQLVGLADGFAIIGARFVSTEASLVGQLVGADGTPGPVRVLASGLPLDMRAVRVADRGGDILVVIAQGVGTSAQRMVLGADLSVVEPLADLSPDVGVSRIDVLVHSGTEHVVYDFGSPARTRVLWRSGMSPLELIFSSAPPALATDGALVAVTEADPRTGDDTVHFFDPVSGADAGRQVITGSFGFAARGLASGDGVVYAAYSDTFDFVLATVTPTEVGDPTSAPAGDVTDDVELFGTGSRLAVTRRGPMGIGLALFNAPLDTIVAAFAPDEVSPIPVRPFGASLATTGAGLDALLSNYSDQSVLSVLECGR